MIYVDYRSGSKELIAPLRRAFLDDKMVEETDLKFADLFFEGRGIGGKPVDIGIEFKKLGEMITSCRDGRFAGHQLPGLTGPKKHYDYAWLLVEGAWRADGAGMVAQFQGPRRGWRAVPGRMRASEYEKHLHTFSVCGGIHVLQSDVRDSTIRMLVNLYRWWTDCDLDKHTSHLAVHQPSMLVEVSGFRRAVMQWPGVGLEFSKAVEQHFKGSIVDAANASAAEWAEIETGGKSRRRLGHANAAKVVAFLQPRRPYQRKEEYRERGASHE